MNLKLQALKNIGSSWFGLTVNILVGFFLSPFILHRLGDVAFGLWVLIFSISGYYGLFDLGIRSSIIRYVSKYTALNQYEELNHLINTSLFSYTCLAAILLLVTGIGSLYVDRIFQIPAAFHGTARVLFLITGSALSLGFPLSIFGGILEGLQKFYILNLTQVIATFTRALLIIFALTHGGGLLSVATVTVGLPLLASAVYAAIVLRTLPFRFGPRFIDRKSFRDVANYGAVTLMIMVGARLRYRADALVIGTFLSAAAITYFTVGARLVDYASDFVSSVAQIFTPMSSHFYSTGDLQKLRRIFIVGNRACALVLLPITTILIIMGKSVITVWVGSRYLSSYSILLVLLIPATLYGIQATSQKLLFGMSKHGALAKVVLIEGVANVGLSVYLVRQIGVVGDALGTGIPMFCTAIFFLPRHVCRLVGVPLRQYLREAYLIPLLMCIPLGIGLALMQRWFQIHNYFQLLAQLAVGGLIYGSCLLWFFVTKEAEGIQLRMRVMRWIRPSANEVTGSDLEDDMVDIPANSEVSPSGSHHRLRALLSQVVPKRLLKERETYTRLGPTAGKIYLRIRLMDWLGFREQSRRKAPCDARSFLFVCYGNIMRSPMSEALLQRSLAGAGEVKGYRVRSAGLHAVPGRGVHPWGQVAAEELGISLVDHSAQPLTREMVEAADAIFVMDFQNKAELLARYPEASPKVFMLSAYADPPQGREIPDPFYGDENTTRLCYAVLQTCIRNLSNQLFPCAGDPRESQAILTSHKDVLGESR